jgi:hypothetical protein
VQVEKFRPTKVKEIVGNTEAVERLQIISEEGNLPNIILAVTLYSTFSPAEAFSPALRQST